MMEVRRIHAFDDNYIWLIGCKNNPHVAIVDPGDADPVFAYMEQEKLEPVAILITHHHGDHTGGVKELLSRFDIPVYGPAHERIPTLTHPVGEGDIVTLASCNLTFKVLDTPGHTRGHVCYVGHDALFCGDTLFTAGCGRLFEGSTEQMYASLEKIRALSDQTLVYCAHEYTQANLAFAVVAEPENPATRARLEEVRQLRSRHEDTVPALLGLEKETNPFLRSHVHSLIQAAEKFAGHPLASPAEVFATVRYWKDTLD